MPFAVTITGRQFYNAMLGLDNFIELYHQETNMARATNEIFRQLSLMHVGYVNFYQNCSIWELLEERYRLLPYELPNFRARRETFPVLRFYFRNQTDADLFEAWVNLKYS